MWFVKKKKIIKELAGKYGTPLYIYDRQILTGEIDKYKRFFSNVFYALKANSNKDLLKIIKQKGLGAEVVSGGELKKALDCGFKPEKIIFSGVGKTGEELELAVRKKIFFINVESYEELILLSEIAGKYRIKTNISVRINPQISVLTHKYINTSEKYSKFGVSFDEARKMYSYASSHRFLNIKAIHFHLGSQIFKAEYYSKALSEIIKFLKLLEKDGIKIEYIDIGGGWGVKEGEYSKNHINLYRVIKPYLKKYKFMLEPGRSIVASCGILVARVLYRKKVNDKYIVIVDAGMNNLIRPALYGSSHPVYNLDEKKERNKVVLDIAGPVCESSDFFVRNIKMNLPEQNDIIVFASCGAYGYVMSSDYNLRGKAKELII